MYRAAAAGEGCSCRTTSRSFTAGLGESLELAAPDGVIRLPIVGIIVDYSDQQGAILIDRARLPAILERRLGELLPRVPGARRPRPDVQAARSSSGMPGTRQVFVLNNDELQGLHPPDHRPVVRPDVRPGGRRRPRGHPRHREHADRLDYRSPARARRAAGRRRSAAPDQADDLDRGGQHGDRSASRSA